MILDVADDRHVEIHTALEKIKEDSGRWNMSLATLRREREEARQAKAAGKKPPKSPPGKEKRARRRSI